MIIKNNQNQRIRVFILKGRTSKENKSKINKWDYIRLKIFCTTKETMNKMNRLSTEWEKIFVSDISEKELISKL